MPHFGKDLVSSLWLNPKKLNFTTYYTFIVPD